MAKKTLQVNINEPCHEDWNKMNATQCGVFCKSCQKEVIDFTNKSEAEIVDILSKATGKVCGRFTADKLNKPLTKFEPDPEWYSWKKWAIAAGVLFGVSNLNADTADTNAKPIIEDVTITDIDTVTRIDTISPPIAWVGMVAMTPIIDTPVQETTVLIGDTILTVDTTVVEQGLVEHVVIEEPFIMGDVSAEFVMGKIAAPQKQCKPKKK